MWTEHIRYINENMLQIQMQKLPKHIQIEKTHTGIASLDVPEDCKGSDGPKKGSLQPNCHNTTAYLKQTHHSPFYCRALNSCVSLYVFCISGVGACSP